MKTILFFTTYLNAGGLENYLLRFLEYKNGEIKPIVICKGGDFGELYDRFSKILNIEIIPLKLHYFNIFSYLRLFKFIRLRKVESVCDFTGNFAGIVLFMAYLAGVKKRLAFYRGSTNHFNESALKLKYNAFVNFLVRKFATKILSNSQAALDFFFTEHVLSKIDHEVIYNGIDSSKFIQRADKILIKRDLGLPENAFVVGHTGRFNTAKNHATILKVAEKICSKFENVYFVFVGKDTEIYVQKLISKEAFISKQIFSLGYRSDIGSIIQIFDLFFFPSITEGQPNALIEAMVAGIPIVASNINPIKETVPKDFVNELISPLDVERFTLKIEEMYLSRELREKSVLKDWAIEHFNHKTLFNKFYKELI